MPSTCSVGFVSFTDHRVWALCALGVLGGCGRGAGATSLPAQPAPREDTSLGVGDVFAVRVYGEPDLSQDYRVGSDGTIDFPLLGSLVVEGLAPSVIAERLEQRLRADQILVDPQVSIFVKEVTSRRVSVVGAVSQSGTFPLTSNMTVVQAISLAGGFSPLASRNDTVVTRREDDELRRYRIRVDDVTRGRVADFILRPGDIVFVPQRAF